MDSSTESVPNSQGQNSSPPKEEPLEETAVLENGKSQNHAAVTLDVVPLEPEPDRVTPEEKRVGKRENFLVQYYHKKTKGLSKTQLSILAIFPLVEFFAATVISIQGPFYPQVAKAKGASETENGLVFGIFELFVFLMAPVYGAHMGKWKPHRLFNIGIFTTSLSCFVFGFVHHIDNRVAFIVTSMVIRTIEAIGDAAFVTASFSIIAAEFPDSVATTFAMMETFYGFGMIAGPIIGGVLYEVGGFTLPFGVMGVSLFTCAVATYFCITRKSPTPEPGSIVRSSGFEMFKMLGNPAIALTAYGTFAAATGIGYLVANLVEGQLVNFDLTQTQTGAIFMLNGGVYALTAPFWGKLCDTTSQPKVFSLIGSLLIIAGFFLIGPIPFIPDWTPSIPVLCIGLIIFGLGLGSTLVSAFILFLQDAIAYGRPDDVTTYGLVSGLWTSMTALGFFVGPFVGGILNDLVGFRWGTLFIFSQQIVLVYLLAKFFMTQRAAKKAADKKLELQDVVTSPAYAGTKETSSKTTIETEDVQLTLRKEELNKESGGGGGVENPNYIPEQ